MALTGAQEALIDRIVAKARSGQLTRAFVSGNVEATMPNSQTLRLKITGATARAAANDWVGACTRSAGNAQKRPSPDSGYIWIDMSIS
jgi:hypothetical protein